MGSNRLDRKRAFITGAASGIGRATAERFADEGARVALLDRQKDKLDEVLSGIRAAGGQAIGVPGDVPSEGDIQSGVASAVEVLGGLDTVVGIAGIELYAEGDTNIDQLVSRV